MGNYSNIEGNVRVDVFKPSGKWHTTLQVDMGAFYNCALIHDGLEQAMREQGYGNFVDGYMCVCTEPHHRSSHPVMLKRMK